MNIFDRKALKLKENITNFATDIRNALTYNPINFAIEMDISVDILKELDYWSMPIEVALDYIVPGKIRSSRLELESMTVLSVALGEKRTRQARLRYTGEYEEIPRREEDIYISTSNTPNWEAQLRSDVLQPQVLTTVPADNRIYTNTNVRGRRSSWRFEDHTYGLGLNDEE